MTPFDYKTKVLNVLDGGSTQDGGSLVTYEFNVENKGYYQICFKYLHSANLGVVSSKNILIDGSIPFKELVSYKFDSVLLFFKLSFWKKSLDGKIFSF